MNQAAIRFEYVHSRWDAGFVTEEERIYVMKEDIRKFICDAQELNDTPLIRHFLAQHEEWDHDKYSDVIESEFKRIKELTK